MAAHLWTIVLAAGAGRRLAGLTNGTPKQFWHYDGRQSLLDATLDRVTPLSPLDRTVIVVDQSHRKYLESLPATSRSSHVAYQPADRGTAPGVLLGLTEVLEFDPAAIVLLTPSDHGVTRPSQFRTGIRRAIAHVQSRPREIVLFGVPPSAPDSEYGWIMPAGARQHSPFRHVAEFIEKPSVKHAIRLFDAGAVWNTMVLVASAVALYELYWTHLPKLAEAFARTHYVPAALREALFAEIYPTLPQSDFSHDVIAPAQGLSVFVWSAAMGWSDLGTPARLTNWMNAAAADRSSKLVEADAPVAAIV